MKKKKKKRERRKTFREDKKGGVWVPYGQVTVIDLQLYFFFWEIMQTNNACEWRTKTGAPRGLANRGPSRGDTSWGPTTRGCPPVRSHNIRVHHNKAEEKHRDRIHQTRKVLGYWKQKNGPRATIIYHYGIITEYGVRTTREGNQWFVMSDSLIILIEKIKIFPSGTVLANTGIPHNHHNHSTERTLVP